MLKWRASKLLPVLGILLWCARAHSTTEPDTVALWLFDETSYAATPLFDATQNRYDLRLTPTGQLTTGKYGNALRLSPGTNYNAYYSEWDGLVVSGYMLRPWGEICGLWGPTITPDKLVTTAAGLEWTCEFWLKLATSPVAEAAVLHFGYAYDPGVTVNLAAGSASFRLTNHYGGWSAVCPVAAGSLAPGTWHHVAFTIAAIGNRVNLFVGGQQQSGSTWSNIPRQPLPATNFPASLATTTYGIFDDSLNYERFRSHRFNLSLGEDRRATADLDGSLDEIRVSSVVRYTGNFTPPGSFSYNYGPNPPVDSVPNGPAILFGTNPPTVPVPLGNRRHLFIDGALLDTTNNVQWKVNVPRIEPLNQYYGGDLNVIDHAGEVWFVVPDGYEGDQGYVAVFESVGGTNFTAPSLGLVEYQGSTSNNWVLNHVPTWAGTYKDTNPNIPADERFKMTAWVANSGVELWTSGDLLHWRRNETIMLPLCSGGGSEMYWDDQNGYYKYFIKRDPHFYSASCRYAGGRTAVGFQTRAISKAWPFQPLASPFWAGWASPAVTCEGPIVFGTNSFGEVYRTRAVKYPWAPDVYLAFLWRLSWQRVRTTDLAISRDGTNWTELGKIGFYLPSGMSVAGFTNGEAVMQVGLVRRGNALWQYANFNNGNHDYSTAAAFARLVQRLDGFVSLDAGATTGSVTTRPLIFAGSRLALNLDSHLGVTKVALLDTNGVALPGYTLTDCNPITTDAVNHIVTWNGNSSVASLSGTAVRVQLQMTQAKLYALQFGQPGLVVVDSVENWNGLENPHVIDGVTLTGAGTAANPYVYTLPAGMTITANGVVRLSSDLSSGNTNEDTTVRFVFAGGNLHMEPGAVIDVARPTRSGHRDFVLDLGYGNITGAGRIIGLRGPGTRRANKPRNVSVINVRDVSLLDVDLHTEDVADALSGVSLNSRGKVNIQGKVDTSDTNASGNAAGNVVIYGEQVEVNDVDTRALRSDGLAANGYADLRALSANSGFDSTSAANAFTNRLTLKGDLRLAGTGPNINSIVRLYGVVAQLDGGLSLALPANSSLAFRVGVTNPAAPARDLFINTSAQNPTVSYIVTWNSVVPGGSGPVFSSNQIVRAASIAGVAYSDSMAGTATDPNGDSLTYSKGAGPAWLAIAADGALSGTPTTADVGTNSWTVSVTDGARSAQATLSIAVRTKPVFLVCPFSRPNASAGLAYSGSLAGAAQDLDGDVLTFAKESGPAWLSVAANGALSGTPGPSDTFTNEWIVSVTDGRWTNAAFLEINVCGAPKFRSDPVFKSPAWTNENYLNAGQTLAGDATSPCGAPLTFAKVSGPGWLNVVANGELSGTPLAANLGTNNWIVSVSDGTSTSTTTLRIVVPAPIVITPQERWDGTNNPHAAQGVTLSGTGTTADPAVYTINTHLRIATGGSIVMSIPPPQGGQDLPPDNSITLKFTGYDLKLETNAFINIGRRARTGSKTANLTLGGGNILGAGQIRGILDTVSSPRVLTIDDVRNVSLAAIDLHVENVATGGRHLNISATGKVEIGSIDNSDVQDTGGDAGDVNISAGVISVGPIKAYAARTASVVYNGNVTLKALGPPLYDPTVANDNTIQNRLNLSGLISTTTGTLTNFPGDITLEGVVVELKPGFGLQRRPTANLTLAAGVYPNGVGAAPTNLFINRTTNALTPNYVVHWTTIPTVTSVTSSANPACPGSPVSFTATVAAVNSGTPVGAVQFKTNGVNFGSAVSLSNGSVTSLPAVLPVGNTVVTAVYVGNTNHGASTSWEFVQTVRSNSVPVAINLSMGAFSNAPSTLRIIGGNPAPTDADGDNLLVTVVTQGTNGSVTTDGTNVTYTATNLFTGVDTFTYRVSDVCASSTPRTVSVSVVADSTGFNQLTPVGSIVEGSVIINYRGLPGYNCALEWATNLNPTIHWVPVVTNRVGTNGWLSFTNTVPALPSFFRTRYFP